MHLSSSKLIDRICDIIESAENEIKSFKLEKRVVSNYTQNLIIIDEQIANLKGQIFALETVLDLLPDCEERN